MHGHVKTRAQLIFNIIGSVAILIFVSIGTVLLVFKAKGYDFDFRTREITQNGLVLIATEPVSASVQLNDKDLQESTPHRMELAPGDHSIQLSRSGYRTWKRFFSIDPGEVLWLTYPLLIPDSLTTREVVKVSESAVSRSSPDSSRIAVANGQLLTVFRSDRTDASPISHDMSQIIPGLPGTVRAITWADNNQNLMLIISDGQTTNYITGRVGNVGSFSDITSKVAGHSDLKFVPDKTDQFYGLKDNALWLLSLDPAVAAQRVVDVADRYAVFGNYILTWSDEARRVVLYHGQLASALNLGPIAAINDLSLSRHDGILIAAITGPEIGTIIVSQPGGAHEALVVHERSGTELLFSPGAGYLLSYAGREVQVYDFERKRFYTYELSESGMTNIHWGTGSQLIAIADGNKAVIFDFDGQNYQVLAPAIAGSISLSPNHEHVLHMTRSSVDGLPIFSDTALNPAN